MTTYRKHDMITGIALSFSLVFVSTSSGQTFVGPDAMGGRVTYGSVVRQSTSWVATQHLGSGPIDRNNLPADILNCEVCRQRLGLPPLRFANPQPSVASAPSLAQQPAPVRMLGSPGKKLESEVKAEGGEAVPTQGLGGSNTNNASELPSVTTPKSLGTPGIVRSVGPSDPIGGATAKPVAEADPVPATVEATIQSAQLQQALIQLQLQSQEQAAEHAKKLEQMQTEWKLRMEQADAANKEALTMLEKRTVEVTELQLQLKSLREALDKAKENTKGKDSDNPESKKKEPNKGKEKGKKQSVDL